MRAQAADAIGGEAHAGCRLFALSIQNAGDDGVGVVDCKPSHEIDNVIACANRRWTRARQGYVELREQTATPAHRQTSFFVVSPDLDNNLFDKRSQKLLLVAIGRGWSHPYKIDVLAQGENGGALLGGNDHACALLAKGEISLRRLLELQTFFPFGFEPASYETVFWIDGAIPTLGSLCFVPSAFDLKSKLCDSCVLVGLESFGSRDGSLEPSRCKSFHESSGYGLIDLLAADPRAVLASAIDESTSRTVIRRGVSVRPTAPCQALEIPAGIVARLTPQEGRPHAE